MLSLTPTVFYSPASSVLSTSTRVVVPVPPVQPMMRTF